MKQDLMHKDVNDVNITPGTPGKIPTGWTWTSRLP